MTRSSEAGSVVYYLGGLSLAFSRVLENGSSHDPAGPQGEAFCKTVPLALQR